MRVGCRVLSECALRLAAGHYHVHSSDSSSSSSSSSTSSSSSSDSTYNLILKCSKL